MNPLRPFAFAVLVATLAACHKKPDAEAAAAPAPVAAPAPTATPPAARTEPSAEDAERAQKQAKLDYATMEDGYINDAHGQWAASAEASSTFGDDNGRTPADSSLAANVTGAPDDKAWMNNHQNMGFDTLQAHFAKPIAATELRIVCNDHEAVESIAKLEVQDTDGKWATVWSGLSDVKPDERGPRTWFVKTFPKTTAPVQAVKVTFANTVASGYKEVNAIQLIGG